MDDLKVDLEGQGHRSKVKVTNLKIILDILKIICQEPFHLGSPNLVRAWVWMTLRSTLKFKVIGQRSGHWVVMTQFGAL